MNAPARPRSLPLPNHVPPHLVFDFDIYADPRIGEDVQGTYARALADAAGYLLDDRQRRALDRQELRSDNDAIVTDPEHFSVREMQIPRVENPPSSSRSASIHPTTCLIAAR